MLLQSKPALKDIANYPSIITSPSRHSFKGLNLIEIPLEQSPDILCVIVVWHPRYNEDALQTWGASLLEIESWLLPSSE